MKFWGILNESENIYSVESCMYEGIEALFWDLENIGDWFSPMKKRNSNRKYPEEDNKTDKSLFIKWNEKEADKVELMADPIYGLLYKEWWTIFTSW